MKSNVSLILSIGLLICLCNCGGGKNQHPVQMSGATVPVKTTQADSDIESSEVLAFNDDMNTFEDIESFAFNEEEGNSEFAAFDSDSTQDNIEFAFNDLDNISFNWEALEEEAREAFETVYFDWDNSTISKEERTKVVKNVEQARDLVEDGKTIVCKGKACKFGGTEVYNVAISDQRAQSVARELKAAGIPEDSIKAFGVGTKESLAMGNTKEDHASDRCVEMYTITI